MLTHTIFLLSCHHSSLAQPQVNGINVEMNRYMRLARVAIKAGNQELAIQNIKLAESYGLHKFRAAKYYAESQIVDGDFEEATKSLQLYFEREKPGFASAGGSPTLHAWYWFLTERKEGITPRTNEIFKLALASIPMNDPDTDRPFEFTKIKTSRVCQMLTAVGYYSIFGPSLTRAHIHFGDAKKLDPQLVLPKNIQECLDRRYYDKTKAKQDEDNNPEFARFDPIRVLSQAKK